METTNANSLNLKDYMYSRINKYNNIDNNHKNSIFIDIVF